MPGITIFQAEEQLAAYLEAERKILDGQRVAINGRELTRADLDLVQRGIAVWNRRVITLERHELRRQGDAAREVIPS